MDKKIIIAVASGCLVLLLVLGFIFKDKLSGLGLFSPQTEKTTEEVKPKFNFEWQLWEDPAGFSFEYPKSFEVNDHPEDENNYANLELTTSEKEGRIIIIVNDTEYADLDQWLEEEELIKDGNALGTEIASMSAKKVVLEEGREVAGFIDWDQVIYTIDVSGPDKEYWQEVYNHILSSFKLIPLEGESEESFYEWLGDFDTSGADIVEAVEVIE